MTLVFNFDFNFFFFQFALIIFKDSLFLTGTFNAGFNFYYSLLDTIFLPASRISNSEEFLCGLFLLWLLLVYIHFQSET